MSYTLKMSLGEGVCVGMKTSLRMKHLVLEYMNSNHNSASNSRLLMAPRGYQVVTP